MNTGFTEKEHYNLGKRLVDLRKEGVLIMTSGNIIHSFKELEWDDDA